MRKDRYKWRRRRRKMSNLIWSIVVAIVCIILLAIFGKNCGEYLNFMDKEAIHHGPI